MRKSLILLLIAILAMPVGIGPNGFMARAAQAQSLSATYQQGANNYTGTQDATISNQYIEWSDTGETDTTNILRSYIKVETGKPTYEKRTLIKFTNLNLPAGTTVTNAKLTVVATDWSSGANGTPVTVLKGYYLNTPWNINAQKLGWLYRDDPTVAWSAEGGKGTGDILTGKSFTLTGFNDSGDQTKTVDLNASVVQSWINNPTSNHGLIIINETGAGGDSTTMYSSEDANLSLRPKLEITYTLSQGTTPEEPASAQNQAPTVNLTSPSPGTDYTAPAEIMLSANAMDDGTIAKVEFYQGNTKLGEDTTAPYQYMWTNVGAGLYTVSAKATDNLGLTGQSNTQTVVVAQSQAQAQSQANTPAPATEPEPTSNSESNSTNQPPTVAITSPANGAEFTSPANITINASAADSDGTITRVDFYRGTQKIGEDTTAPYSYNWQNVGAGEYHISAVAVDNGGEMTGSQAVHLKVNASNQPPTVAITSPANNAEFTSPANITLNASASDSDGTIARVDFYRGTQKIGEDTTAPYSFVWQNVGAGNYHVSAIAVDNGGEMTGSQAVHLKVNASNLPPTVSITAPVNGAEFTSPANITLNASASDSDGTITRVDFYRGTLKIGEDTTAPYSFVWQNVGAGDYHVSAIAVDNGGEMTGSQAVHVVINQTDNTPPPTPEPPAQQPPTGDITYGVNLTECNNATVPANAVYVSTAGNDGTANGSQALPYRTIRTAVNNAVAGATIVIRGGTYVEPQEIRVRVPNVTIRSYPGEWAVIDRSADTENVGMYFYVGSNGGKLQCLEVKGGFYAVSTETQWDWGQSDRSGASDLLIENTKLHDSFRDVVKIKPNSDRVTIRHNEIYNSNRGQTGECNAEGIDNVNGDKMLVQYNHIHDTCSTGVYFKGGATDGIVEYNLIENTGAAGIILGFDTSPEYFDLTVNPDYYENIRGIARYNLIKNTGWGGIALYASKDGQVYNNTLIDTAKIYHSPIYYGITFQDWEDFAKRPANINPTVRDNIVVQNTVTRAALVGIRYADELGGLSALSGNANMNNNCYYQAGRAATFEDGRTDWNGSFTEWRSHMGAESGSMEINPNLDTNSKPTNPSCANRGHLAN